MLAALATATVATQIVFKTGKIKVEGGGKDEENRTRNRDFKVSTDDWKMQFRWPKIPGNNKSYRCTATMVTDQVAITAAHCVRSWEAGVKTGADRLRVRVAKQNRRVKEIRVPECWDFASQGPLNVDVAMLILNKPLNNVVEGVDYAKIWDPVEQGEEIEADDEFVLAGYGTWNDWNVNTDGFYDSDLNDGPKFHKGSNLVEYIQSNFYYFRMTNFYDGGLKYEVGTSYGDSGGGGLVEKDGKFYTIGVVSHGYYSIDEAG